MRERIPPGCSGELRILYGREREGKVRVTYNSGEYGREGIGRVTQDPVRGGIK